MSEYPSLCERLIFLYLFFAVGHDAFILYMYAHDYDYYVSEQYCLCREALMVCTYSHSICMGDALCERVYFYDGAFVSLPAQKLIYIRLKRAALYSWLREGRRCTYCRRIVCCLYWCRCAFFFRRGFVYGNKTYGGSKVRW